MLGQDEGPPLEDVAGVVPRHHELGVRRELAVGALTLRRIRELEAEIVILRALGRYLQKPPVGLAATLDPGDAPGIDELVETVSRALAARRSLRPARGLGAAGGDPAGGLPVAPGPGFRGRAWVPTRSVC